MADPYVLIEGGMVQNTPEIPVFDMDELDEMPPSLRTAQWDNIVEMRDQMKGYPALAYQVKRCDEWLIEHGEHDPALRSVPQSLKYDDEWSDDSDPDGRGLPR